MMTFITFFAIGLGVGSIAILFIKFLFKFINEQYRIGKVKSNLKVGDVFVDKNWGERWTKILIKKISADRKFLIVSYWKIEGVEVQPRDSEIPVELLLHAYVKHS